MPVTIIANVDRRQKRVAIMEGSRLLELKHETEEDVVGNIYLGKVTDVVPGLDACFVNVGIEKNAFLHVSDALPESPRGPHRRTAVARIADVVKSGQEFLVQVTKGPLDTKGARATRHISLAGRYLVLTTDGDKVGISKKIESEEERRRLRDIVTKLRPEGFGLIVRTRAEDAHPEDFERDIKFLTKVWKAIEAKAKQSKAPALIHADISLVFAVVRDIFNADVDRMIIDDKVTYDQVLNLLQTTAPELRDRVEYYRGEKPIFEQFGVEQEIDRAIQSKVPLAHGGHLNIESTIALTTIDVNSGKFTGAGNLEETVLKTNLDACDEVARQLRLRDIGGIIVIDFIDMDKPRHRKEVTTALRNAFAQDRMRTRIMHITKLGLVEMTRKRTGESLVAKLQTKCPCCGGSGQILAPETVAQRAINSARSSLLQSPGQAVLFLADPDCTLALIGPHGTDAEALEEELGVPIFARATYETHPEVCTITLGDPEAFRETYRPWQVNDVVEITPGDTLVGHHGGLLALVQGCVLEVPEISSRLEAPVKVRLTRVDNSYLRGTPAEGLPEKTSGKSRRRRKKKGGGTPQPLVQTPEAEAITVLSWAEEAMEAADALPVAATEEPSAEEHAEEAEATAPTKRRRRRGGRRRHKSAAAESTALPAEEASAETSPEEGPPAEAPIAEPAPVATPPDTFGIVPGYIPPKKRPRHGGPRPPVLEPAAEPAPAPEEAPAPSPELQPEPLAESPAGEPEAARPRRSPRRSRPAASAAAAEAAIAPAAEAPAPALAPESAAEEPPKRQPRRRARSKTATAPAAEAAPESAAPPSEPAPEETPSPRRRRTTRKTAQSASEAAPEPPAPEPEAAAAEEPKPRRRRSARQVAEPAAADAPGAEPETEAEEAPKPRRRRTPRKTASAPESAE